MYRYILLAVAIVIVAGAGLWHGQQTARWGESDELNQAVERINHIRTQIGDWESRSNEIDPRQLKIGEIAGYTSRTYVNRQTKEQVSILLICGRPGPISVHTPDVCYQGAGYTMGQLVLQSLQGVPGFSHQPEFWSARFTKEPGPQMLNILWTWSNGGIWIAPDHPRWTFYRSSYLYKLYIIRPVFALGVPLIDGTTQAFLHDLLPELMTALSGSPTQPTK